MTEDFVASAKWLKARPESNGKLGAIGFCFGGGIVNQLAVRLGRDLNAGVPFYGRQPSAEDAAKITAPLMLQYADATIDTGVGAGIAAVRGRAQGEQQDVREIRVRRRAARLPQRHDAALRRSRRPSSRGSGRSTSSTRTSAESHHVAFCDLCVSESTQRSQRSPSSRRHRFESSLHSVTSWMHVDSAIPAISALASSPRSPAVLVF